MKPLEIKFDLRDVVLEFSLDSIKAKELIRTCVEAVTLEVYRQWQQAARERLKSSRAQYITNLQIVELGETTKAIVLNGKLPNMIENGCSAFDLKAGFMKSAKVKFNKEGGWYLTIPFRFGTPGIVGESAAFSAILPDEVYNILKNREGTMTAFNGGSKSGNPLKSSEIPAPYDQLGKRDTIMAGIHTKFAEYVHKSSIYSGIVKDSAIYEKTGQNSYNSFRRAGANSDPLSWIHTGIQAYNLADQAVQNTNVRTLVDNTVDSVLEKFGFSS